MADFGVYEEFHITSDNKHTLTDAHPTMSVKGDKIRCRLVCKGCYPDSIDKADTYTSAPLLISPTLLLLIGLPKNYSLTFYDVNTAFLHAELQGDVYIKPPIEFSRWRHPVKTAKGDVRLEDRKAATLWRIWAPHAYATNPTFMVCLGRTSTPCSAWTTSPPSDRKTPRTGSTTTVRNGGSSRTWESHATRGR